MDILKFIVGFEFQSYADYKQSELEMISDKDEKYLLYNMLRIINYKTLHDETYQEHKEEYREILNKYKKAMKNKQNG